MIIKKPIVILANGSFPYHQIPLDILKKAKTIICLDGAVINLIQAGLEPNLIMGDLDSINSELKIKYSDIIINMPCQNNNDLRKAMDWIEKQGYNEVSILGATGLREDHTISNIFSILETELKIEFKIFTDYGTFQIIKGYKKIESFKNQAVSLFTLRKSTKITTYNLKYNLNKESLSTLFYGTLNNCTSESFSIKSEGGPTLLYTAHLK